MQNLFLNSLNLMALICLSVKRPAYAPPKAFSVVIDFIPLLLPITSLIAEEIPNSSAPPLIMGIFPRHNATDTMTAFRPLAQHLSVQLGREVKLITAKDFKSFWQGLQQQDYDLVHYNQYHYVVSHEKQGYQVILKNEESGEATIAGALIVRKDSGINSIADLKGKKILFGGGPKAMQSYIVATYLLRQGGLQAGDYIEEFAKNPPNAILSAFYGQAAAAGSGDKVLNSEAIQQQIDTEQLKFLARGEQLAHLPWAVKGTMNTELRDKIQNLLTHLQDSTEGMKILEQAHLTALLPATDEEYDPHRAIIKAVYGNSY